jgi:hypothetical protein
MQISVLLSRKGDSIGVDIFSLNRLVAHKGELGNYARLVSQIPAQESTIEPDVL